MDLITKTPGFIHIAEEIFSNLDRNSLLDCQKVNEYWGSILRNPWFWFHRMTQRKILSQEHKNEWMDFCEKLSKLKFTNDMTHGLNFIYGCLEDSWTLDETYWSAHYGASYYFMEQYNTFKNTLSGIKSVEIVRIMAPLLENPNAPDKWGKTPIFFAVLRGHTEIVKILAPLTIFPNVPDNFGDTPLHQHFMVTLILSKFWSQ